MTQPDAPSPASPRDAASAWSEHAADYARLFAPLTGGIAQELFRRVAHRLPRPARVLDIACGPGQLTLAAAEHTLRVEAETGQAGFVLGTDFAPGMVAHAEALVAPLGRPDRVRCEVHDGQSLALATASFDAAFSAFGIFLFPDRLAGWREAARVLRPGGLFATAVWRAPEHNALYRVQREPVFAALPERLRQGPLDPPWLAITEPEALAAEVCAAGPFLEPEIAVFDAQLTVPTAADLWHAMLGNPVASGLLRACTSEELAAIERSALASFETLAGGLDRPLAITASCHLLVARRA